MNEVEAIGEVVSGGLAARAIEPEEGESDGHTDELACLNCGAFLTGDYCHACGQRGHVHRTLGAFFHDLAHGVFHFEGKIWRTLPMLAWRPGELTRRYIDGQRARFVSPMALFLFCIFLMFAVVSATGNLNPNFAGTAPQNLAQAELESLGKLKTLQQERRAAVAAKASPARFDAEIKAEQGALRMIQAMRSRGITEGVISGLAADGADPGTWIDLEARKPDVGAGVATYKWLDSAYRRAKQNPQLLIYKLKTNSYKWSWALIPLSLPFLWLLFPFSRRFRTYDHVVFVTYSLCFMSLLVIAGTAFAYVGVTAVAPVMLLIPPFHIFRQLRGAYALSFAGALWRTIALIAAALLVMSIFILLMVGMGTFD